MVTDVVGNGSGDLLAIPGKVSINCGVAVQLYPFRDSKPIVKWR